MHLVLLALSLTAHADPTCAGPIELRTFNVPVTTYAGGVAVTTQNPTWTALDAQHRALDTLTLAARLGDDGVATEVARRQQKARKTGWIVTGVAVPTTALGAVALNSSVNGDGGDGALVGGASLLSLGAVGLMFGPIWLGVRPWALRNNPATFYTLDDVTAKIEAYHDECGH